MSPTQTNALALLLASGLLVACTDATQPPPEAPAAAEPEAAPVKQITEATSPELGSWGFDTNAMDANIAPGDDFFGYANGGWLESFEMPADRSRYGAFTGLAERAETQVRAIIETLATGSPEPGSVDQKVGDFFSSWMNEEALSSAGTGPLYEHLNGIAKIETEAELQSAFADIHATAPFGVGIIPDPADTAKYTVFVSQAGLGMPDRDYYLKDEEPYSGHRAAYRAYVEQMQTLAGIANAGEKADAIVALETRLAEVHWPPERSRQISEIYNPMSRADLKQLAPQLDWDSMMDQVGLGEVDMMVVAETTAISESAKIYADTPLETWKDYLTYHFIRTNARFLPQAFDEANFAFFGTKLQGTKEQRDRWKRGVQLLNGTMGEAVGQVYVARHFPPDNRAKMQTLVDDLVAAFEIRLQNLDWMDEETREQALRKLSTFEPRIGYPSKWTDYSSLQTGSEGLLANALSGTKFQWELQLSRLGGPVDRDLWAMNPQTVNAYYNPLLNQITFPAAILQPPFFDPNADPAVNYGAIGAVIGHEIGHGFDDQGRRFDETGMIRDWWTETANERFQTRAQKLIDQYDAYMPLEDLHVNGNLTLGENIGDLGGLQMAYAAYQRYQEANGKAPVIDGYTGEQRFFLSWAQAWRAKTRDDALRQRILTDPHSPEEYRTNGVVRNLDAWYAAFNVTEEHALYLAPEDRVKIW